MPVDYSKWDALELSDDSDIEVHPNVDKRSFIRAKQTQIHQQRFERKHKITTFKYERIVNAGLLARIDFLLKSLERHSKDAETKSDPSDIDELVFNCLMELTTESSLGPDLPPTPPEGVHSKESELSYSRMMGALVDQTKQEVDKTNTSGAERYKRYIKEVKGHQDKVNGLQKSLNEELAKLEKEEAGKITSENIHTGFDSSHVNKSQSTPTTSVASIQKREPELLNPAASSGSEADVEDGVIGSAVGAGIDDDDVEASPLAKKFGKISYGDYSASLDFIGRHPEILAERETDDLLVEAFNAQSNAKNKKEEDYARQCVHQALLLQYCRQLGRDGVGLFFKRVQTQGHQARKLFLDDVDSTYARIRSRTAEIAKEQAQEGSGDREQIQLHAVDPNTTINIVTPPPLSECQTDDEKTAREIFDTFPPGLQRALESGSLDRVNEVLGKMSVDEAEEVVEQLGNGGMLSLEEGVIDATTEEGKKAIEEIERTRQMPGQDLESAKVLAVDQID